MNPWLIYETTLAQALADLVSRIRAKEGVGRSMADFGSGDFRLNSVLAVLAEEHYGIDNWVASEYQQAIPDSVRFAWASVYAAPFASGSLDCVAMTEVLEHLRRPDMALKEVHRVLRPGGSVVVSVPFGLMVHGAPNDYQRFTIIGLKLLLEDAGLDVVEYSELGGTLLTVVNALATRAAFDPKRRYYLRVVSGLLNRAFQVLNKTGLSPRHREWDSDIEAPRADRRLPLGYVIWAKKLEVGARPPRPSFTLACPFCKSAVVDGNTGVICQGCALVFPRYRGYPVLMAPEHANVTHLASGATVPIGELLPRPYQA